MKQESMSIGTQPEAVGSMLLRFSLYTLGILCIAVSLPWVARIGEAAAFRENGMIEWLQFGVLLAVSFIFARDARRSRRTSQLSTALACLAAFAAVREMNGNLDETIPWLGWKIGYVFIVYAGYVFFQSKQVAAQQTRDLLDSNGFLLLWAGFIIAIPFAQLVGNTAFLQAIMEDDYSRDYRRIIEEIGELMGYGLILIGSVELIKHKNGPALIDRRRTGAGIS